MRPAAPPSRRWVRYAARPLSFALGLASAAVGLLRHGPRAAFGDDAPTVVLSVGDWMVDDLGLHQAAFLAVLGALGARVVEVTPQVRRDPTAILDGADALVLAGGGDVDPRLYGGDPGRAGWVDRARDDFEVALVREALRREIPILGVCRGHQVLNVALGGSLRDLRADAERHRAHGVSLRSLAAHEVDLAPGSLVRAAAMGAGSATVNSFHAQAIDRLGPPLVATATAPDGIIEAVELPTHPFALGVQWHPELSVLADPFARDLRAPDRGGAPAPRGASARPRPVRARPGGAPRPPCRGCAPSRRARCS